MFSPFPDVTLFGHAFDTPLSDKPEMGIDPDIHDILNNATFPTLQLPNGADLLSSPAMPVYPFIRNWTPN